MPVLSSPLTEWLSMPWSGVTDHDIASWAAWHGRLMVMAWAFLLPLGVMAARFFKVLPGQDWPRELDHKAWWHAHRVLQYLGVLVMTLGIGLVWTNATRSSALAYWHAWMDWVLLLFGWLQHKGRCIDTYQAIWGPDHQHPGNQSFACRGSAVWIACLTTTPEGFQGNDCPRLIF